MRHVWLRRCQAKPDPGSGGREQRVAERKDFHRRGSCANRVDHVLCDPEKRERKAIGYRCFWDLQARIYQEDRGISDQECEVRATAIEIAREFGKREDYWLVSTKGRDLSTTIFVCGDAHVDGFRNGFRIAESRPRCSREGRNDPRATGANY